MPELVGEPRDDATRVRALARVFAFDDPMMTEDKYHDLFAAARKTCPVVKSDGIIGGSYLVSRFDDVGHCLKDWQTWGHEVPRYPGGPIDIPLQVDPPLHTLMRRDLAAPFILKNVLKLKPDFEARARSYLRPLVARGGGDLLAQFCQPFPVYSFMSMFGAPLADTDQMIEWKNVIFAGLDGNASSQQTSIEQVFPDVERYFNRLIDDRIATLPEDRPNDLLTAFTTGMVGDRPYTRDEIVRLCRFFMVAGLDTVTVMLARILLFLARNPMHYSLLKTDPSLIPNAIEELMRYAGITSAFRVATTDTEVNGVSIRKGERVELMLAAAGRDDSIFDNPESVDFHRQDVKHFNFGAGPHRCLGLHLARVELEVALEVFVEAVSTFSLDERFPEPRIRIGAAHSIDHVRVLINERSVREAP